MRYVKPTDIQIEMGASTLAENAVSDLELLLDLPDELTIELVDIIWDYDWEAEYLKQHYASYEEACENEADQRRCE